MQISGVTFSWFDLAALLVIGAGVYRGRAHGMSEELLEVLKWLVIVVLGGFAYRPVGQYIAGYTHASPLTSYITAYMALLLCVRAFFGWVKRMVGEKLVGSDVFGAWEYYMGMGAGGVRFACYLIVGLALLNAKHITQEQLAAEVRMQKDNFGDISFPTVGTLQQNVFVGSVSGKLVKQYLGEQLIVTTAAEATLAKAETLGRRKESTVSEVLGER